MTLWQATSRAVRRRAPFDVAIVGGRPVGAVAANLVADAGLRVLVIEREAVPYPLPRAVHLDHEMIRLFPTAGSTTAAHREGADSGCA